MELRCEAPSKRPRYPGEKCRGFVAGPPEGSVFVGFVNHSSEKQHGGNTVAGCLRCKTLHEFAPDDDQGRLKLVA